MDKLTQHALEAAKDYLRGNGPWKDSEIGITEDDYLVQCFAKAIREANRRGAERERERLKLDLQAKDCLQVSAYHAGMKHGWNCAISGDMAAYDAAISTEHIAELRSVNEARDALKQGEQ